MGAQWADTRGAAPSDGEKVNFYGTLNLCTGEEIVQRRKVMNAEGMAKDVKRI